MNEKIYPISRIVTYIKSTLEKNPYLSGILIQGEVSNLTKHRSGHWYFTLKDSKARLSCVMFASYAFRCRFDVQDGAKVIIKGSISLYEPQGSVQCYVTQIRGDGLGEHTPQTITRTIEDYHYLRPIPQGQLDAMTMSEAEKNAYQNPGYE